MLGYVTLGTDDLEKTSAFFDQLFQPLGAKRLLEVPRGVFWGIDLGKPFIGVMKPFDGKAAACGNGTMVAMPVSSREQVDQMYQLALRLGSTCEGAPGERMPGFYAAYFRTPQGYKMNFFKMG